MNKGEFISNSQFPALAKAVILQLGGWSQFKENAHDISMHGIDGGFGCFVYYSDTVPFAKKHLDNILSGVGAMAEELGVGKLELIANFQCLRSHDLSVDEIAECIYGNNDEWKTQIFNALAWFAAEECVNNFISATDI